MYGSVVAGVAASMPKYKIDAVTFDGSNDWLNRSTALTGSADGKQFSISFWVYYSTITTGSVHNIFSIFNNATTNYVMLCDIDDANQRMRFYGRTAGYTTVLATEGSTNSLLKNQWNHVLFSVDLTVPATHHYVNDGSVTLSNATRTNSDIDLNGAYPRIGAWNATQRLNGSLAELWYTQSYIDFSVEANRRKFISGTTKKPTWLGTNGSVPTGTQPLLYFSGPATTWNAGTNKGSGGTFTVTGAVADSSVEPVDA